MRPPDDTPLATRTIGGRARLRTPLVRTRLKVHVQPSPHGSEIARLGRGPRPRRGAGRAPRCKPRPTDLTVANEQAADPRIRRRLSPRASAPRASVCSIQSRSCVNARRCELSSQQALARTRRGRRAAGDPRSPPPTPTKRIRHADLAAGSPSAMPPLAVPSSLVRTTPVNSGGTRELLGLRQRPFCPVVASTTRRTS